MPVKLCSGCGLEREHRARSDSKKTQGTCNECIAAYSRRWRRERWQQRKAYDTWRGMIRRCHDPKTRRWNPGTGVPSYRDYGALGIRVCRRWLDPDTGFEAFVKDLGPPPTREHTLDRKNPRRSYCPSNTRWVDKRTQDTNRKNTVWVTAFHPDTRQELTLCLSEWARETGLDRRVIGKRIRAGWPPSRAVYAGTAAERQVELQEVPF